MAFLCPNRLKDRKTKKKEREPLFGRITGSDSVDTLIRVGLEKQHGLSRDSKMVAIHDFRACAEKELDVNRGQIVYILYTENSWAYVLTEEDSEGFVPLNYLQQWARRSVSPSLPEMNEDVEDADVFSSVSGSGFVSSDSYGGACKFLKRSYGRYVVVFDFDGIDENDVSVEQCEVVTVLNMEDPDWYWVFRSTGEEGFVPKTFLCPFPADLNLSGSLPGDTFTRASSEMVSRPRTENGKDVRKLITTRSYDAQSKADLTVTIGDVVLVDLTNQNEGEWLWAYSQDTDRNGYVPRSHLSFIEDADQVAVV